MTTEAGWSDAAKEHTPRIMRNYQKPKEARKDLPLEPSGGAQHCRHLDLGFLASRTVR